MIIGGKHVVNPEVVIARRLERGGRAAPGLDFIRWRVEQLREEIWDDAEFWGIPHRDIALSRAAELAAARSGNEGTASATAEVVDFIQMRNVKTSSPAGCA